MKRFDGDFNDDFRALLKRRRQEAGYCYRETGERLRVAASTVQKWEKGEVARCREKYVERVADFLHGDAGEKQAGADDCTAIFRELPFPLTTLLGNVVLVYQRLPQGEKTLMMERDLTALTRECLAMLENT